MKIWYRKIEDKPSSEYVSSYRYDLLEFGKICCPEMQEAVNEYAIYFDDDKKLSFSACRPYPEGAVWDIYGINYCPFCGKKIKYIEKEQEVI